MVNWPLPNEKSVGYVDELVQQRLKYIWRTQSAGWSHSVRKDFCKLLPKAHVSYSARFPSYHAIVKRHTPMTPAAYMILQTTYGVRQMERIKSWVGFRQDNEWTRGFREGGVLPVDDSAWLKSIREAKDDAMPRKRIKKEEDEVEEDEMEEDEVEEDEMEEDEMEEDEMPRKRIEKEEDEMPCKKIEKEEDEMPRKKIEKREDEMPRKRIEKEEDEMPRKRIKKKEDESSSYASPDAGIDKQEEVPDIDDDKDEQQTAEVKLPTPVTAQLELGGYDAGARQTLHPTLPASAPPSYSGTARKDTGDIAKSCSDSNNPRHAETKANVAIKSEPNAIWSRFIGRRAQDAYQSSNRFGALETQIAELKLLVGALEEKERMLEERTASLAEQKAMLDTLQRRVQMLAEYIAPQE
ncbi:hypothetical protein CDD81_1783 [Ophiocordyceps australis]|uniref:Uncharacterized protein n=1 Tax=Ophiocordyceps australis TaxID=1399860 RepID=A0A2C5YAG3_9HYPO|nr:hypothetical protein CDD81_1783 [Ophiocordyceps australis]